MQDFILTLLFNIPGIGAASGLVYDNQTLYLVSDNSHFLYIYDIGNSNLNKFAIIDGGTENIPKKQKPDFETLALYDQKLYAFGSGSTPKRNQFAVIEKSHKTVSLHDISALYSQMRIASNISSEEFNIEGAVFHKNWYFFQRGNGIAARNGVFTVTGDILSQDCKLTYNEINLPDCNGIAATFTDAIAVNDKIYFLGTSENSNSVYDDGEILGSIIGLLNPATMEVEFTLKISDTHKFEGLTLFESSETEITFLLCEDNDAEMTESGIYKLTLKR